MADTGALKAPDDLVELGRVVSAYGVKGWVKVQPHSAQAEVLRAAPVWWLRPSAPSASRSASGAVAFQAYPVKQVRPQGASVVACLTGIDDRDIAETKRGFTVHVSRNDFPAAKSDEFYWVDLVGCLVYGVSDEGASGSTVSATDSQSSQSSDQILYGRVSEVVDNGAHALLRVDLLKQAAPDSDPVPVIDAKGRQVDILIPFVSAHVQHVDIAARRIETNWPLDY